MLDTATLQTFSPHLGDSFLLRVNAPEPVAVTLVEAVGTTTDDDDRRKRAPFSLVFRGPANAVFSQGIYHVTHDALGAFDVFLVPIKPDAEGPRLEAVFN